MSKTLMQKKLALFLFLIGSYQPTMQAMDLLLYMLRSCVEDVGKNISIEKYFKQVRHDLQPLAPRLINDIIQKTNTQITLEDKKNLTTDLLNQKLKSTIISMVYDQANSIAKQQVREQQNIDPLVASKIAQSLANNVRVELEKSPQANGQALYTFFGDDLKQRVISSLNNPAYANYYRQYTQSSSNTVPPAPSAPAAPPAPVAPPAPIPTAPEMDRNALIKEVQHTIKIRLASVLSSEELRHLQQLYAKQALQKSTVHPEDFSHIKDSLLQLLDSGITSYGRELGIALVNQKQLTIETKNQLQKNILNVRAEGAELIKSMKRIDKEKIESLFGKNLKAKLSENIPVQGS